VPLRCTGGILLGYFGIFVRLLWLGKHLLPKTIGNQESFMIGLRFLVNDGFCLGSDGRMDMEARFLLSLGSEFSELLDERLVLLEGKILFAEKDNATSRHDDTELSNQFIGIRSIEKIFQLEIGVLTADAGSDLEIVVMIKTASWLERLDFQLWKGYGGHSEIVTLALLVEKFAYKYEVAAFRQWGS